MPEAKRTHISHSGSFILLRKFEKHQMGKEVFERRSFTDKKRIQYTSMKTGRQILTVTLAAAALTKADAQTAKQLRVNGQRIMQHLQELSEFGRNPQGGVSRIAYSQADLQGREYAQRL